MAAPFLYMAVWYAELGWPQVIRPFRIRFEPQAIGPSAGIFDPYKATTLEAVCPLFFSFHPVIRKT